MARNPLRVGRRKPYKWPRPSKPQVVEAAERPVRLAFLRSFPEKLLNFGRQKPHLIVVSALFIFMFATDRINFITFLSLGFFCLLFSDHLVDSARGWHQRRLDKKAGLLTGGLLGSDRHPKLAYYQQLAKKQRERTSSPKS